MSINRYAPELVIGNIVLKSDPNKLGKLVGFARMVAKVDAWKSINDRNLQSPSVKEMTAWDMSYDD